MGNRGMPSPNATHQEPLNDAESTLSFDPMCGWCYGATELLQALLDTAQFELIYHPGGMIQRQEIPPSFRQHIALSDERIASETGAKFGTPYKA